MRKKPSATHSAASTPRPARRIHEEVAGKLSEIACCPRCGSSYRSGRWTSEPAPADSYEHICPACERIEAAYPAGVLQLDGDFVASHRDDLISLIRNVEERERSTHPLKRIMAITEEGSHLVVTVTDAKLALALGRALESAYKGQLEHPPTTSDKENLVRVQWTRD